MLAGLPALAGNLAQADWAQAELAKVDLAKADQGIATPPRNADPVRQRSFDPREFGAAGDGSSDDTPAFRAMYAAMRRLQAKDDTSRAADASRPPLEIVIRLSPGHYRYTWNRWTWGLRRVSVIGYGAAIQCLHAGPYDVDQAALTSNRDHYWTWDPTGVAFGPPSRLPQEDYGRLIRSATAGDESVVPASVADASLFRSGQWVLVQSLAQQQDGYPPNMRHFDRARILDIGGGRIRLDRPLRHAHRDDWPEDPLHPAAIGRARIVAIDRPDCPFALSQRFIGLTILSNPNHAERDAGVRQTREILGIVGVLQAQVRDCTLIALGVSQAGDVSIENSTFAYTEPDKLVDRLTLRDCRIGSISECTGVNQLMLQGCTVETSAKLLARDVVLSGCTFLNSHAAQRRIPALILYGQNPTRRMTVAGCRFFGTLHGLPPIGGSVWTRLPIDGADLRLLDSGRVRAAAGSQALGTLCGLLEEGWPMMVVTAGKPRFGSCSGISGDGSDAVFAFAVADGLRPADILAIPRLLSLSVQDCGFAHPFAERPDVPDLTWEDEVARSRRLRLFLRSDLATRSAWLPGHVRCIRCLVARPYTGPDDGCLLSLKETTTAPNALELLINLKVPGEREATTFGARLKSGDSLRIGGSSGTQLPEARYVDAATAQIVGRFNAVPSPATGLDGEQARFSVEIEVDSPFAWTFPA